MEINDDLLINYLLAETGAEENRQIELWCQESPANQQHVDHLRSVWELSRNLQFEGEIDPVAALQRLKNRAALVPAAEQKVVALHRKRTWYQLVAALLLIGTAGWLYTSFVASREMTLLSHQVVTTDTLSDGSVVTLNKNSLLTYPSKFKAEQRLVSLTRGEAFFNISPNKAKPFIISAGRTMIKVIGTSFNVKNRAGDIEVIVETGIVQVIEDGQMLSIRPGEKVMVKKQGGKLIKTHSTDRLYDYYRSKQFVADNTPLWRMVQVLNEAYNSHILIGRNELRDLTLNTTFKNESLADILQVICSTFHITMEKKQDQIILY